MAAPAVNPFVKRDSHDKRSLLAHRVLTLVTWLLVVVISVYYSLNAPLEGRTILVQVQTHPTSFSLNLEIISLYWTLMLLLEIGYIYFLSAYDAEIVNVAANVGSHFIFNNLLLSAFILLWVYSRFWIAEIMLVINFFNLTSLYFRHLKTPLFVHYPVVTAPLCFTFMIMLFNGAVMVGSNSLAARICAYVAVWWVLFYGLFFLIAFKDYAVGWEMCVLSLALAIQQLRVRVAALQWIFAVVVTAVLLLMTLVFTIPPLFGRELVLFQEIEEDEIVDGESQALLNHD